MRVVVADRSRVMRQIISRTLRQAACGRWQVVESGDGYEVLDLITTGRVDLVLSEWRLDGLTGLQLLATVRDRRLDLPFVFVTAERHPVNRELALAAGADDLIGKPFTTEHLRQVLAPLARAASRS